MQTVPPRAESLETEAAIAASTTARAVIASLRPYQWVKNLLVFGGLVFSRSLTNFDALILSFEAFALFCIASSGVYLLNDLRDVKSDRLHAKKRLRPLASGLLTPVQVVPLMLLLVAGALAGGWLLRPAFGMILAIYLALNILYSMGLKRLVIADVLCIGIGFVLRAVAGAVAIGVPASPWIVLCTLLLAVLVGFGKRRHELATLSDAAGRHRANLDEYSLPYLDHMMGMSGAAAVMAYALYTMDSQTYANFGTRNLLLTVPCVMYGIFRYLFLVHRRHEGGDPAALLVRDVPTVVNGLLWVSLVCLVIYGPLRTSLW